MEKRQFHLISIRIGINGNSVEFHKEYIPENNDDSSVTAKIAQDLIYWKRKNMPESTAQKNFWSQAVLAPRQDGTLIQYEVLQRIMNWSSKSGLTNPRITVTICDGKAACHIDDGKDKFRTFTSSYDNNASAEDIIDHLSNDLIAKAEAWLCRATYTPAFAPSVDQITTYKVSAGTGKLNIVLSDSKSSGPGTIQISSDTNKDKLNEATAKLTKIWQALVGKTGNVVWDVNHKNQQIVLVFSNGSWNTTITDWTNCYTYFSFDNVIINNVIDRVWKAWGDELMRRAKV